MGRRALGKVCSDIDASGHLIESLDELSAPLNVEAIYGRDAPLEIEIGSGKGMFLTDAARASSDRNFLGIEIGKKYAHFAATKLAQADLPNARMISGDALKLFREFIPDASVAAVHVYFPDPWWKRRHRKRRVMNEDLVHDIQRVLVTGGKLYFWTDVKEYFDVTLKLLATFKTLNGPFDVPPGGADEQSPWRTHFDRRMKMHDEPVYRSEYRRL